PHQTNPQKTATTRHLSQRPHQMQMALTLRCSTKLHDSFGGESLVAPSISASAKLPATVELVSQRSRIRAHLRRRDGAAVLPLQTMNPFGWARYGRMISLSALQGNLGRAR